MAVYPSDDELIERILNEPKPLSRQQRLAVLCNHSHIRIIAGAGAGKTETLTRRIVYLLLSKNVDPSAVVAFTFTDNAAESMKSRVYERVKHLGGNDICARLGEMFVGTIHAYCNRLLQDHFGYGDWGALDENQEMAYIMQVGWDLGLGQNGNYSINCEDFLSTANVYYNELIPESRFRRKRDIDFLDKIHHYETLLDNHKQLTFNRMIRLAVENLRKHPEVTGHIKHLIVDEYQDINHVQEELIQLIGTNGNIFIVGDPRQTIYQWRGSDETCFKEFATKYPNTATIHIKENRRSTVAVIETANGFSDTFCRTKYDHIDPVRTEQGKVLLTEMDSDVTEVRWIADQIQFLVDAGKCAYKDIALLFRSVTTSAPPFIEEFRRRDIRFVVGGKVGLFRRLEILGVGQLFAWLWSDGFWIPSRSKGRISGENLLHEALMNWNMGVPELTIGEQGIINLRKWKESVLSSSYDNFTQVLDELLVILGYHKLDPGDERHAVIMANLGRFNELLTDNETAIMLGGKKRRNWEKNLKDLCWYMNTYASSKYDEQTGDDIAGIDAVQLTTIHQCKGLEWPLVFIPCVVHQRFPSSLMGKSKNWLISEDLFEVQKYEGDEESERKLMYVAMTRARDVAVVSYFTSMNGRPKGRGDFIDDIEHLEYVESLSQSDTLPDYKYIITDPTEELHTFTAGELIAYGKCGYFYRLRHVWGYQPGLNEYLGYGTSLHFCMRVAAELIKQQGMSPLTAVATAVNHHFHMPFMAPGRTRDIKEKAKEHLMRFTSAHIEDMLRILEVETRVEFPVQNAIVSGKIDVILHDGDAIEVREYKTTDTATTPDDLSLQLRLYTRGLVSIGKQVSRGSVAFLEKARVNIVNVSETAVDTTVEQAEKSISNILEGNFEPCPGTACKKCDYQKICKWRAY